MQVKQLWS